MKLLKPIAITLMTALIFSASSPVKDKEGHVLSDMWKEFYSAQSADKPKTQESALEKIRSAAKQKHLTWDYYDATVKLAQVRISGNWKLRESETASRDKDIIAFGEPIAEFFLKTSFQNWPDELRSEFIKANETTLKAGNNPEFYHRDWHVTSTVYGSLIPALLHNDYEYCLWSIRDSEVLRKEFKTYPLSAFAEFESIPHGDGRETALKAYMKKWDGKAASLLAEQEILSLRFQNLDSWENDALKGKSADFEALRDDCNAFENKRKAFKGEEKKIADCCITARNLLETMSYKNVNASITDSRLTIRMNNLDAVTAQLFRGKEKVWEKYLTNPYKSYFVEDRLLLDIPEIPDGTYTLKCFRDKVSDDATYNKYTISASVRRDAAGLALWAADFLSGGPLKKVDVELLKDDKVLKTESLTLDGYTTLPASLIPDFSDKKGGYALRVRCNDGRERASRAIWLYDYRQDAVGEQNELHAIILTDRGAYNPDETLHFKAILYRGTYTLRPADKGIETDVCLYDAQNKLIEQKKLITNEFGSIAGEFTLKRAERNGQYRLSISCNGKQLNSRYVRVDDYVFPSFDLIFDKTSTFDHPVKEIRTGGSVFAYSGHSLSGTDIRYSVRHYSEEWASGIIHPDADGRFELVFPTDSTNSSSYDWYQINVRVTDPTGETLEWSRGISIRPQSTPRVQREYFFDENNKDGRLELKVVAGDKPVWMVVEAHGPDGKLLWKRMDRFAPAMNGKEPAETTIRYALKDDDPEVVDISVIYFQNKSCYSRSCTLRKPDRRWDLELGFTRFLDTTVPGTGYTFDIKTAAGVECAATVFDKSTERYAGNQWLHLRAASIPGPSLYRSTETGTDQTSSRIMVRGLGSAKLMSKAANVAMMADSVAEVAEEEAAALPCNAPAGDDAAADIPLRENFANTIAWEPFLRSDSDGRISFSFTNADKLSTYYVQLFAHDKSMRNEVLRREMVVTIPVKISMVQPQFLYVGDKYVARVALSSAMSKDIRGTLTVQLLDGTDHKTSPIRTTVSCEISVPAKGSATQDVVLTAPGIENLGIKAVFRPESGSFGADAVFVSVPVKKAEQSLTEAHSAVLLDGRDKAALEAELRALFENVDSSVPKLQEINIRKMIEEALPEELEPRCDNAIALARSLYAWSLCSALAGNRSLLMTDPERLSPSFDRDGAIAKLLACRNSDGGFGWFAGMDSSPLVTAVILRLVRGLGIVDEASAVRFIDSLYFAKEKKGWWYRGLTLEQYLSVRSLFPEIEFKQKTDADFRKAARAYLVPSKARGLNGMIAAKARRVQTLDKFLSLKGGISLASKMGVRLGTASKLRKSLAADVASLVEYAQPHKNGGVYYPNAVMPWRGLLETELDAHCDLISIMDSFSHQEIANGIRLWIMLQKETQDWKQDPGYIRAIGAVLSGPDSVLDTKVLALKATYTLPFEQIRASGNGMTITASSGLSGTEGNSTVIPGKTGEPLRIGDRVRLTYTVTNEENRSFVKVTIPFGAGLVPVNLVSGYQWGRYRNVLADRIEYWYEVYPEEKTELSEEFFVTRAGSFQAPVAEIECEYAPHYRANDSWRGRLEITAE